EVEVGRSGRRRRNLTELEATRLLGQFGDQVDNLALRRARRRERVARRDRTVGLDLDRDLVVVRGLLDTRRLDRELHTTHRPEHNTYTRPTDRGGALVALRRKVAAVVLDGEVERQAAGCVHRRDVEVGVEDLDVGRGLDVGR